MPEILGLVFVAILVLLLSPLIGLLWLTLFESLRIRRRQREADRELDELRRRLP